MPELRRNHYLPKSMLKHWATPGPKYPGVYCYDIRESRQFFANANGGAAFAFAISNDLYVPVINGERAPEMEKWFSSQEDALAGLVKQAHTKKEQITIKKRADTGRIVQALVGLECRSRYDVQRLREALRQEPSLRAVISNNPERDEQRLVLENIINLITERALLLDPIEITFLHTKKRFICSDRPFCNDPQLDYCFVVLTNTCVAAYTKSRTGEFMYQHKDAHDGLVDEVNKLVALNARDWLIADSQVQLDQYVTVIHSEEWRRQCASEKLEVVLPRALTSSWSIPESRKGPGSS